MNKEDDKKIPKRPTTGLAAAPTSANERSVYFGEVTFTGSNTGAWHQLYDGVTEGRLCVAFKCLDDIEYMMELMVSAYQYPDLFRRTVYLHEDDAEPDAGGYIFVVTDYFPITDNDMRIVYDAHSFGSGFPQDRRASVHLWVDVR